jgi:hypothetical protein
MFFVTLHKPYRGQVDEIMIRADLILEVSTRRQRKKDVEYDPAIEEGVEKGTWILVDRLGWTAVIETPSEVANAMLLAEVYYRERLAAGIPKVG